MEGSKQLTPLSTLCKRIGNWLKPSAFSINPGPAEPKYTSPCLDDN